jgi:hypothetical protein
MNKIFKKFVQCGVLGFSLLCQESYSMTTDVDLMERGEAGMAVRLLPVAEYQRDFEMPSYLNLEIESNVTGVRAKGIINGIPLCVCLTSVCVVGGLSVLHLVGLI